MKSLVDYINEASSDFQKKTLDTANLIKAFEQTFDKKSNPYKDNSISLNNKTDLKKFHKDLINTIGALYPKNGSELIRKFEIGTPELLKKFLYENVEKLAEYKLHYKVFKDFNETEAQKEFNAWKKSDDYVETISDDEAEKYQNRAIVIYDRYNPASHIVKPFDGKRGKSTDHLINMFRMEFMAETGTKYFNCYSILYTNYVKGGKDLEEYHDIIGEND